MFYKMIKSKIENLIINVVMMIRPVKSISNENPEL